MVLDVRRALQTGYDDLTSEAGLNVFSVLLVFNLAYGAVVASFRQQLLEFVTRGSPMPTAFIRPPVDWEFLSLELPLPLLAVLAVGAVFAGELVRFWAIRLFADLSLTPVPERRERVPILLAVGGGVTLLVFGLREVVPVFWAPEGARTMATVSQATGVVSLIVVGLTVYLRQEIALTDAGVRETVEKSVARFLAEPVPILGLLALLGLLGALTGLPPLVGQFVVGAGRGMTPPVSQLLELGSVVLSTVLTTFSIATVTNAYVQIRGGAFR